MTTSLARCPQNSTQWNNSYTAASSPSSVTKSVGRSLWFNTNSVFASRDGYDSSGNLTYTFPGQSPKRVVERVVIGNHTFFRVSGY
ncbi:hypothetical protein [Bacillus weihaiensis]|nr:hypothetical protein [Bacillus weihaiensis]